MSVYLYNFEGDKDSLTKIQKVVKNERKMDKLKVTENYK